MSAVGTPSSDPWVVLSRERARYEEQFKSLKPINGVVTGEQAKGFFLQSQLPPLILGQIWALADTDADGKMDINEFSIACKLINLKLRGFDVPKVLPPQLIASLKALSPPAIPPLPNPALVSAPIDVGKVPPPVKQTPVIPNQMATQIQPLLSNIASGHLMSQAPVNTAPTGIIPPMPVAAAPTVPNLIGGPPLPHMIPPISSQPLGGVPPIMSQPGGIVKPTQPPLPSTIIPPIASVAPSIPGAVPVSSAPLAPTASFVAGGMQNFAVGAPTIPTAVLAPLTSSAPVAAPVVSSGVPGVPVVSSAGPSATSTPRASVTSIDRAASIESPQVEWAVPHQVKLKYTQIFNTTDRARSGYLSGAQARNVMVQTKLPQNILAQVWALSDMDSDGRLGCEEFVLAMHLCEQAAIGNLPPTVLPPDLIPPSFRRGPRTASISSQGSVHQIDQDPASTLPQTSFEDKRKENFEKGQAELERRRKALLDQQKKEAEERERKEREELEKREKARQEAERRRLEELEKQLREQQEQERMKEEERKRQAEQREAARKEMERQRQLEWEKQRLLELQQQRQREQENVLKLKAKNQSLTIELSTLNDQVRELSQKICDTRVGVSNVKSTIDGMRSTRDSQMQEMSQLKNKLKEQNAKLLTLSQEKARLDAKNKLNMQLNDPQTESNKQAFDNKEIIIKNLREKIEELQQDINNKMSDIENNNSQLNDLRSQLSKLVSDCESLYNVYEEKKDKVLKMKNSNRNIDYTTAWKDDGGWGDNGNQSDWPVNDWNAESEETDIGPAIPGVVRYRALYEFSARNQDEITFQPGDIINVPIEQNGEPGWLAGEIRGHTGWFPESYVERVDKTDVVIGSQTTYIEDTETKPSEETPEFPESTETTNAFMEKRESLPTFAESAESAEPAEPDYYIANYPYQSIEQGDLSFNAGDVLMVLKKDGDWWTGKLGEAVGIFPSNYVQKFEGSAPTNNDIDVGNSQEAPVVSQTDNEVSQITTKAGEKPIDFGAMGSNAQTMKGKKPEIASVIAPYQATSPEQLSLARGQLIMIRKKTDSGWWEGELQAKGKKRQVGWFPASYVKVLNSSGRISGRSTPVSTTRLQQEVVIDKVVALYPYTAANPDELSFLKDDIISVTARDEAAWWRGELNGVSGLFPSNYVAPLQSSQLVTPQEKMRSESINEFIKTEKAYIDDMTVVNRIFEKPLRESKVVPEKNVEGIFVNWESILECNKAFLNDLLDRQSSGSDTYGDIICAHLPKMTCYTTFCSKQLEAATLLQKLTETSGPFRDIVRKCQNNVATRGMPLSSFLIKPMQRITKYPLLVSKILENTPDNHPDRPYLEAAVKIADNFLKFINENVRVKENQDRLEWMQEHIQNDLNIKFNSITNKMGVRRLIHYGCLTKVKSGKELIGFLLNDFILFAQPSKNIGSQFSFQKHSNVTYKMYRQPILIQDLSLVNSPDDSIENGNDTKRILRIQDKDKNTLVLLASSVSDCNLWLKEIDNAKIAYNNMKSPMLNRPKSIHTFARARAWLSLTVVQGHEIIGATFKKFRRTKGKPRTDNIYCKVVLGDQEQQTDVARETLVSANQNQKGVPQIPVLNWNYSMQFHVKNLEEEALIFTVYESCLYTPDEFLGKAELKVMDVYAQNLQTNGPLTKKLILHQVESGEIVVKLDLQMFSKTY